MNNQVTMQFDLSQLKCGSCQQEKPLSEFQAVRITATAGNVQPLHVDITAFCQQCATAKKILGIADGKGSN